jgi:hypothetical protein
MSMKFSRGPVNFSCATTWQSITIIGSSISQLMLCCFIAGRS